MNGLLAQKPHQTTGLINGLGPLGELGDFVTLMLENVLSTIVGAITIIAGIWFIFILITGGVAYMSAGSDKGAVEEARKRITTGLIGLIIVISATFIVDLLGYIIGVDVLNITTTFIRIVNP